MRAAPHTLRPISLLFSSTHRYSPKILSRRSPAEGTPPGLRQHPPHSRYAILTPTLPSLPKKSFHYLPYKTHQATAQPFGWVFAWRKGVIRKTANRWFVRAAPTHSDQSPFSSAQLTDQPQNLIAAKPCRGDPSGVSAASTNISAIALDRFCMMFA